MPAGRVTLKCAWCAAPIEVSQEEHNRKLRLSQPHYFCKPTCREHWGLYRREERIRNKPPGCTSCRGNRTS